MLQKIYTKDEVQEKIGYNYTSKICAMVLSLKTYQVINVFHGKTSNEELINKVMAATALAIEKWEPIYKKLGIMKTKKAS